MTSKVRRVDLSPSEYVAGVTGLLTVPEYAVYSLICMMIYERQRPILDDHKWLSQIFAHGTDPRTIRAAIEGLVRKEKVQRSGGDLMVNRCLSEIERASKRIKDATEAANERWKNNDITDAPALNGALPSLTINDQPSTIITAAPVGSGTNGPDLFAEQKVVIPVKGTKAATRGTRLPDGWEPSDKTRRFAEESGLDWRLVLPEFVDYWRGVAGQKGVKIDWEGTFRNRCRQVLGFDKHERYLLKPTNGHDSGADVLRAMRVKGFYANGVWKSDWGPQPPPKALTV
jgi:uncharacterized protein YdaU (DUF1376 family)